MYKTIIAAVFGLSLAFGVTGCSKAESEECKACKQECVDTLGDNLFGTACQKGCEEQDVCK
jgi:hypothetical protein